MTPQITLSSFIDWLRTKPAEERYDYTSATHCLIAQFLVHLGADPEKVSVCGWGLYTTAHDADDPYREQTPIEVWIAARDATSTFGSVLRTALALQSGERVPSEDEIGAYTRKLAFPRRPWVDPRRQASFQ